MDSTNAIINDIKKLIKQLESVVLIIEKKLSLVIISLNDFKTDDGYGIRYSLLIENAAIDQISISNNIEKVVVTIFL